MRREVNRISLNIEMAGLPDGQDNKGAGFARGGESKAIVRAHDCRVDPAATIPAERMLLKQKIRQLRLSPRRALRKNDTPG
jgi:hypothetical protein